RVGSHPRVGLVQQAFIPHAENARGINTTRLGLYMKNTRKTLIKSGVSALIIALFFPAIWLAVLGDTSQTPVMEKRFFDNMSEQQRTQWIEENSTPVSFIEHLQSLPSYISQEWEGYLEASLGVFLVVFVINSAFMLGGRKGEP
ncbi:MAG: hypothetical protein AB2697_21270, partial [Candidatus Thiodiazotropha endolucinida]